MSWKYIVYYRTRPTEPEPSETALRQQRAVVERFLAQGDEVIAEFTEQEFVTSGSGDTDPRPQFEAAARLVRNVVASGDDVELAVLREDAIGSGVIFDDQGIAGTLDDEDYVALTTCGSSRFEIAEQARVEYLRRRRKLERAKRSSSRHRNRSDGNAPG